MPTAWDINAEWHIIINPNGSALGRQHRLGIYGAYEHMHSNAPQGQHIINPMPTAWDISAEWHIIINPDGIALSRQHRLGIYGAYEHMHSIAPQGQHIISPMPTAWDINAEWHHINPTASPRVGSIASGYMAHMNTCTASPRRGIISSTQRQRLGI